jgi:hypothetical protein
MDIQRTGLGAQEATVGRFSGVALGEAVPSNSCRTLFTLRPKICLLRTSERRPQGSGALDASWVASRVARVGRIWLVGCPPDTPKESLPFSAKVPCEGKSWVEWFTSKWAVLVDGDGLEGSSEWGELGRAACRRVTYLSLGM